MPRCTVSTGKAVPLCRSFALRYFRAKQDGLLHRSQIPRGHVLNVGDVVDVEIQKVEADRGRIGLAWTAKE